MGVLPCLGYQLLQWADKMRANKNCCRGLIASLCSQSQDHLSAEASRICGKGYPTATTERASSAAGKYTKQLYPAATHSVLMRCAPEPGLQATGKPVLPSTNARSHRSNSWFSNKPDPPKCSHMTLSCAKCQWHHVVK